MMSTDRKLAKSEVVKVVSKRKNGSRRVAYSFTGGSNVRTQQSFVTECDINTIISKYRRTGLLGDLIKRNPQYGDFSEVGTYQEAYNTVLKAEEQFSALPSNLREKFNNKPEEFLKYVHDPKNADELVEMGLATRREPSEEAQKVDSKPVSSEEDKKVEP